MGSGVSRTSTKMSHNTGGTKMEDSGETKAVSEADKGYEISVQETLDSCGPSANNGDDDAMSVDSNDTYIMASNMSSYLKVPGKEKPKKEDENSYTNDEKEKTTCNKTENHNDKVQENSDLKSTGQGCSKDENEKRTKNTSKNCPEIVIYSCSNTDANNTDHYEDKSEDKKKVLEKAGEKKPINKKRSIVSSRPGLHIHLKTVQAYLPSKHMASNYSFLVRRQTQAIYKRNLLLRGVRGTLVKGNWALGDVVTDELKWQVLHSRCRQSSLRVAPGKSTLPPVFLSFNYDYEEQPKNCTLQLQASPSVRTLLSRTKISATLTIWKTRIHSKTVINKHSSE